MYVECKLVRSASRSVVSVVGSFADRRGEAIVRAPGWTVCPERTDGRSHHRCDGVVTI